MALTQVTGPYPIFTDLDGTPLDDGYLYIGEINEDPETNPIQVYWDSALTIVATQPIRTSNGYAYRNGSPALLYTAGEFSITIRNKRQEFVLYSPVGYGFDPAAVSASVVKNDFVGDGVEVDFTLSASPSTKLATNIFINGVYQEKDSYSLLGNVITFSIAPPLNSSVEVMTNETGVINTGNATAISYTLTAPGAVAQTVQTKLDDLPFLLEDFGGGATATGIENANALRAALAAVNTNGGGVILLRGGVNYNIDSATWGPGGPGAIPANTTIATTGGKASITFTGSTFVLGLRATSVSNVLVKDIKIIGNNTAGSLLEFHLAVGAGAPMTNVYAENILLQNCAAETGFLTIINYNATFAMDKVGVIGGAEFIPAANAVPLAAQSDITKIYAAIYINATAGGAIRNLLLDRPIGGLNDYKMGIFATGNIDTVQVTNPIFTGVGQSYFTPANEGRGYRGIAFYRNSGLLTFPPRNIVIDNPVVTAPIDNGIYLQSCDGVVINSPQISGQNGTFDNNLAEAGIYSNGSVRVIINDLNFENNHRDIVIGGSDTVDVIDFQINGGFLRGANLTSIVLNPALAPITMWRNLKINNVVVRDALYGVLTNFISTSAGKDIVFSNCDIEASGTGSYGVTSNGLNSSGEVKFIDCRIKGAACQVNMNSLIGAIEFESTTIETGSTIADFITTAGQKLRLFNTHFAATSTSNPFTGNAQILTGVAGAGSIARNCTFGNTSNPVTGSNIMAVAPTWSGSSGDFVQSGNSAEQGAVSSKYVRSGWVCSGGTTWLEQRQLTGN